MCLGIKTSSWAKVLEGDKGVGMSVESHPRHDKLLDLKLIVAGSDSRITIPGELEVGLQGSDWFRGM